jgi:cytochrome b561
MKDTKTKLSGLTVALHWIVGLAFIAIIAVGFYMTNTKTFALYPLHKSFGILLLFFIVARVIWRMMNGWPVPLKDDNPMELLVGKVIHWVLILGTLIMPISGMVMSYFEGRGAYMFGLEILASNPDLANPGKVVAINAGLAHFAEEVHEIVPIVLVIAIVLHIAGAIKQHVVHKNGTLLRMKGKQIEE